MRLALTVTIAVASLVASAVGACTSSSDPAGAGTADAGDGATAPSETGAPEDAAPPDAAQADAPASTKQTNVVADIGGVSRTLARAQFGTSKSDSGKPTLHVEAHEGGDPACPNENSPATDRTLVVSGVPEGAPGETFTEADGVTAAFFDFKGDQLAGKPLTKATAVKVTLVTLDLPATPVSVELDVDATFPEGSVKGRIYALYCASMSD
jgi:hypothetical protein